MARVTPEGRIKDKIVKHLRKHGAWVHVVHAAGMGVAGTPDLLVCHRGLFLAIEVKTPKGRVTRLQEHMLARISQAGGSTLVARDVQDVERWLNGRVVDLPHVGGAAWP